ncbi:F-box/LRR-repeat protein [Zostera marina]|uniref:F-box/LRR-repeat protein n=1 Tax=Zostera marina TaxID=29655 RepID=A0A0K9PXK8_ZOSMR|nr:F-box/LRR-repeat protein [Zostera marina]
MIRVLSSFHTPSSIILPESKTTLFSTHSGTVIRIDDAHDISMGVKRRRRCSPEAMSLEAMPEEILFCILDKMTAQSLKSVSLSCKTLHNVESRHRRTLKPLRSSLLPAVLSRYTSILHLDLTLCPCVPDSLLFSRLPQSLLSIDLSRSRGFSAAGLTGLVGRCGSLVEIDVSGGTELGDAEMAVISDGAKRLERLRIRMCKGVTDVGVGMVAVGCSHLRELRLKSCSGVTDLGVELVAVKCRMLEVLDLSFVPITGKCLPAVLQLQYLQELYLSGCSGIDYESLMDLDQKCESLHLLDLSNCENVSHVGLCSITNGTTNLRQLILSYSFLGLSNSMINLSKLHSIKLDGCKVNCSGLKSIGNSNMLLKELSLSKCNGVTDESLSYIVGKHRELVKLDITCCRGITHDSIVSITKSCSYLTSLRLESCSLISVKAFPLIGQCCRLLEDLNLTDTGLDDEGLKAISACSKLSSLKIGFCLDISDNGLIYIGKACKNLKEIDLYRSDGITDVGITAIALGCSDLETIDLAYCTKITDNSMNSLSNCSKLSTLEIRGCSQVSSLGVSTITVGCRQITNLDMKRCSKINDAGMLSIAHYSQNLRHINISYCSITDMGLLALANISCLQSMTILHVKGLSPSGLTATLMACGGLTKVKLHVATKSLLPLQIIEHIKSRGCVFQWIHKPISTGLLPTFWPCCCLNDNC